MVNVYSIFKPVYLNQIQRGRAAQSWKKWKYTVSSSETASESIKYKLSVLSAGFIHQVKFKMHRKPVSWSYGLKYDGNSAQLVQWPGVIYHYTTFALQLSALYN